MKSLQDYLEFAQAVINNPPEPVQEIVNKEFASKTQENIYNFSRITKEQVLLKEVPFADISGALIKPKHNYFVNREQDPGSLLLLEAKRKEPDCGMDLTEIEEKVIEAVQSDTTIPQGNRSTLNTLNTFVPECYDFEEGEFDGELDVLVIIKEKFFKGIEKESNRLNFIDLKKEGLVAANDDRLVAVTFKEFRKDLEKGFPGSVLSEVVTKNAPNIAVYYDDVFEESADFFVPVRNFKGIAPAQFEHARFNASVWQDASLRSVLSSHDFSKPFVFAEVPGKTYFVSDFVEGLDNSFFSDFEAFYKDKFKPVFDRIVGFISIKKENSFSVPGLVKTVFSGSASLSPKKISLKGTRFDLKLDKSLSELDSELGTSFSENPFLFLPFDGSVGLKDNVLTRNGYGTDVLMPEDTDVFRCPFLDSTESSVLIKSSASSNAFAKTSFNLKEDIESVLNGKILRIEKGDVFSLLCSPSVPVKLFLLTNFPETSFSGNITDLFYGFRSETDFLDATAYGSLNSLINWEADSSAFPDSLSLTGPPTSFSCNNWPSDEKFLARLSSDSIKDFSSVVFVPRNTVLGLACSNTNAFLTASLLGGDLSEGASVYNNYFSPGQTGFPPTIFIGRYSPQDSIGERSNFFNPSFKSFLEKIRDNSVCALTENNSLTLEWNKDYLKTSLGKSTPANK